MRVLERKKIKVPEKTKFKDWRYDRLQKNVNLFFPKILHFITLLFFVLNFLFP